MDEEDGGFGVASVCQRMTGGYRQCNAPEHKMGLASVTSKDRPGWDNGWTGTGAIQETRLTGRPCLHPSS